MKEKRRIKGEETKIKKVDGKKKNDGHGNYLLQKRKRKKNHT